MPNIHRSVYRLKVKAESRKESYLLVNSCLGTRVAISAITFKFLKENRDPSNNILLLSLTELL